MPHPEWVRVRLPETGMEVSLSSAFVDGLPADAVEVLDVPATDSRNRPLRASRKNGRPVKTRTSVQKEAAKKAPSKSASSPDDTPDDVVVEMPEEATK